MKHLKNIFRTLFFLLIGIGTPLSAIANKDIRAEYLDSVEFSLLTCQPHDEVYSLYGHTALRYHDLHDGGEDWAYNYGLFSFDKPFFVLRFVFGLTDYELGAMPYADFQAEYRYYGSEVTEQVLNLSREDKLRLIIALEENRKPENRVYRYNYFYNNCTTKARDIVEQSIDGRVEYSSRADYEVSYRNMVHEMTRNNPWAAFGNDLLLGIKADMKTDRRQQEFLPNNLMYDFDRARIYSGGSYRPLIKEHRIAVPAGVQMLKTGFPLTPWQCSWLVLAIAVAIFIFEMRRQQAFLLWDILLMTVTGVIGITLFLMLFSQHPTVSLNLQFLLFNPLPWFFMWAVIRRRGRRYWQITAILSLLFLLGSLFQHYAAGMVNLALCLLLQCLVNLKYGLSRH